MDCGRKWTLVENGRGRKWTLVDRGNRGEEEGRETVALSADDADDAGFLGCVVQGNLPRNDRNAESAKHTAA